MNTLAFDIDSGRLQVLTMVMIVSHDRYTVSIGYMRALLDLGLLNKAKYMAGISGGSWASSIYTYARIPHKSKTDMSDDEILLGEIIPPENITKAGLSVMDSRCARGAPNKDLTTVTTN
jgi:hypothetical protein